MNTIEENLPHRKPFLFLDEIVELGDDFVVARRTIREDEPQFQGHYPGRPIMPGVLLTEAVLQAGCFLLAEKYASLFSDGVPVVTRLNNVKFKQMVTPGDSIEIRAEYDRSMMGAHFLKGTVRLAGKLAVSMEFACMVARGEP